MNYIAEEITSNHNGVSFGEGPEDADVMLIGQNPGKKEVKEGRPFVGRSGKYLDKVLYQNGIERSSLYLTGVVKESTPGNRKPTAGEIKKWMPILVDEIKRIKPRIVVLMGWVAWQTPRCRWIKYIETYHPAAAMRFPGIREKFEKDIRQLARYIEKWLSGASS